MFQSLFNFSVCGFSLLTEIVSLYDFQKLWRILVIEFVYFWSSIILYSTKKGAEWTDDREKLYFNIVPMNLVNDGIINNCKHKLNIKYNYGCREYGYVKKKLSPLSYISTVFNFQLRHGVSKSLCRRNITGERV